MKALIKGIILGIYFLILFLIWYKFSKYIEKKDNKDNEFPVISFFAMLLLMFLSLFMAFPLNYGGIMQKKSDNFVDRINNYVTDLIHHNNSKGIAETTMEPTKQPTTVPKTTISPTTTTPKPTLSPTITSTPKPTSTFPNLKGMKKTEAINACVQSGYKYSIEYYLGGDGTVISQSPKSNKKIKKGGKITINIGIPKNNFSKKLLKQINKKRTAKGLKKLKFSKKLNTACKILAKENVNSTNGTRPDGSRWSTIVHEKKIYLLRATFTTRDDITSLSDASKKLKYTGNNYGSENLLTPSYNIIGMAYSSKNMLVIIVGEG